MLSHHFRRIHRQGLLAAGALALAVPASASADSLVFLKGGNVWLSAGDGSGQYQVTTDGGPGMDAYSSPTQADDGTIAVGHGANIELLAQNGTVLRSFDAPGLTNSVSHPADGNPYAVAISPDGARIAYSFSNYECPIGASCGARVATGFVDRSGTRLPGNLYHGDPSWATNSRLLTFGGYGAYVNLHDVGQPTDQEWIQDANNDLADGQLTRDGKRLALIYGYGADAMVATFAVPQDARTGAPPTTKPVAECQIGPGLGLKGPTWRPDGGALAWEEPDGIWTKDDLSNCEQPATRLAIPGASAPFWGPANVNPAPRTGTGGGTNPPAGGGQPGPSPGPGTGGTTFPGATAALAGKTPRIARALSKGLELAIAGAPAGSKVRVSLTVDPKTAKRLGLGKARTTLASGTANASAAGLASVRLTFTRASRKRLGRSSKVKATIRIGGSAVGSLTLRR